MTYAFFGPLNLMGPTNNVSKHCLHLVAKDCQLCIGQQIVTDHHFQGHKGARSTVTIERADDVFIPIAHQLIKRPIPGVG